MTLFEPYYRPLNILDEFETIARKAFGGEGFGEGLVHNLDIYREKNELVVKAELPGIEKENLDISLEDDVLTIKAEKKQEEVAEDATYYRSERRFGQYSRTIALPFDIDAEKVSATLKDGVLEMRLPRAEDNGTKRIEVKVK